jgi:hypothetical protein
MRNPFNVMEHKHTTHEGAPDWVAQTRGDNIVYELQICEDGGVFELFGPSPAVRIALLEWFAPRHWFLLWLMCPALAFLGPWLRRTRARGYAYPRT